MAAVKLCSYCGRENADEATHCSACATEFISEPAGLKPSLPRERTGVKAALAYLLGAFLLVALYFLSFGPVMRFCATLVSRTTTTTASGFTHQVTISCPRWVYVVYYPAFALRDSGEDGFAGLYRRYIEWWEQRIEE